MIRRPPKFPLFPSPTLFRSALGAAADPLGRGVAALGAAVGGTGGLHSSGRHAATLTAGADSSGEEDRKSTRLNSSHANISYAVFCLKKKHYTVYATTPYSSS